MTSDEPIPEYSIWSFCYAKGQVPRDFVEGSPVASNQGQLQIPMVYSVIATSGPAGGRTAFLVDTGFAAAHSMTGRTFSDVETPTAVLAKIELEPQAVTAILLTHMHFDHIGNIDAFPEATIFLQRSEYEGWKRALQDLQGSESKRDWILSSMNLEDVHRLNRAFADGRVRLIDGPHQVAPGIRLELAAETHTFGSQWIEVRTAEGPYIVAGDAVVSFANLERMWPPGYHQGNCWNLLRAYRRIKEIVGTNWPERVVPGHDMELFRRFPSWTAGSNPVAEIRLASSQQSFRR